MHHSSVRRRFVGFAAVSAATLVVACGEDKRVKELNAGISRDSAIAVIAQDSKPASGATPDSFPNVYAREHYLIGGKNYEVLFFTPNNAKFGKDTVPYSKLTPIVFVENNLVAKGWDKWDSISTANKIPLKDHK